MEKEELERLVEVEQRSKSNMKKLEEHDVQFKEVNSKLVNNILQYNKTTN